MERISSPPWDFEQYRRGPIEVAAPQMYAIGGGAAGPTLDNSGAAQDPGAYAPFRTILTGGSGANKVYWACNSQLGYLDSVSGPQDGFRTGSDPIGLGNFWRKPSIYDCWLRLQTVGGTINNDSTIGISLGIQLGFPPYPATSFSNIVRLYMSIPGYSSDAAPWYLSSIPGDNATPATIVPNPWVPGDLTGGWRRVYRVRLVHQPGEYVEGYVDGRLVGRITTSLPTMAPITGGGLCGIFVESGTLACFVRGVFAMGRLQVLW